MILVTVGTNKLGFDRLLRAVDKIAQRRGEKFIVQKGFSPYEPPHVEWFTFKDKAEMLKLISQADIVVTHGGFGILGDCIRANKRIIIVSREKKYGEAVNPQWELAEYLASRHESIICVRGNEGLDRAIEEAIEKVRQAPVSYNYQTKIPELIEEFIKGVFQFQRDLT